MSFKNHALSALLSLFLSSQLTAMEQVPLTEIPYRVLEGHTESIYALALTKWKNRDFLVSGAGDATIKIWDLESDECIKTLQGHTAEVHTIKIVPQDNGDFAIVSSSYDGSIRVWDFATGEHYIVWAKPNPKPFTFLGIESPGNNLIAFGTDENEIKIWNIATRKYIEVTSAHPDIFDALSQRNHGSATKVLRLDEKHCAQACFDKFSWPVGTEIWNTEDKKCIALLPHSAGQPFLAFRDNRLLSGSCCDDAYGELKVWDWKTGTCLHTYTLSNGYGPAIYAPFAPGKIIVGRVNGLALFDYENLTLEWDRTLLHHSRLQISAVVKYHDSIIYAGWGGHPGCMRDETAKNIYIVSIPSLDPASQEG